MDKLNRALVFGVFSSAVVLSYPADGSVDYRRSSSEHQRTVPAVDDAPFIITELMYDPASVDDNTGEWFEIYNPSSEAIDLIGLRFTDASISASNDFTISESLEIGPGEYLVFAQSADLGNAAYGVTADYVWATDGAFKLNNSVDTIHVYDGADLVVEFAYDEQGPWPTAVGESSQVARTLYDPAYQTIGSAWCEATSPLAAGSDKATPGAENDACPGVDIDEDGYYAQFDCDDESAAVHFEAIEVGSDALDNDCDGITLFEILTDAPDDSALGLDNELLAFSVGWDESHLLLGFDHTNSNAATIWYIDTGVSGGENQFSSGSGYGGAYPTEIALDRAVDLMVAVQGDGSLEVFRIENNTSTSLLGMSGVEVAHGENLAESSLAGVAKIPWELVYTDEDDIVPNGSILSIAGVSRAGDDGAPGDFAPNQSTSTIGEFVDVVVDESYDGVPDLSVFLDQDEDGIEPIKGDCDDLNPLTYPDADEICDGKDNDCDGVRDEGVTDFFYLDLDLDGYGAGEAVVSACEATTGLSATGDDCLDNDGTIHPGADEYCNNKDNDCDDNIDESAVDAETYYPDGDEDGFGDDASAVNACSQPAGHITDNGDCDDGNAAINPDGTEVCDGGVDNDCNGLADDDDSGVTDPVVWYEDSDDDGHGNNDATTSACVQPDGYVASNTDCDDTNDQSSPDVLEVCDGTVDNDCDGDVDEAGATDVSTFFADVDQDSYGDSASSVEACAAPDGYVSDDSDCNDGSDQAYPGGTEICDELDNDCDGVTDGPDPVDGTTYYVDADVDGYGVDDETTVACSMPDGDWAEQGGDCDDTRAHVNPGADEIPSDDENLDENCDGEVETTPTPATPTPATPTPDTPTEMPTESPTPDPGTGTETETPTAGETPVETTETPTDIETETPVGTPTVTEAETEVPDTPGETPVETPIPETPSEPEVTPTVEPPTAEPDTPTATEAPTDPPAETSTPAPSPTPTEGDGGEGGCECSTGGNPVEGGALSLFAMAMVGFLRRRRI